MIHVFIGTKAQYIKTAPLLRLMDERGTGYRLIDSGQHAALSVWMRGELGVRDPDLSLGGKRDVNSIPRAVMWMMGLTRRLRSRRRLFEEVFGGVGGVCVVHGDTPSTLVSTLMAKRAGLSVAQLEAGLRSHKWLHPFPEELIRMIVMRRADVLFAPDQQAIDNLADMNVSGRVVRLEGNTSLEAVRHADPSVDASGSVVVTMHRVENLHRKTRRARFVDLVESLAGRFPVRFVLHEPTRTALGGEALERLAGAGIEITPLTSHAEFVGLLGAAPFVVTDGGSIQEECALLGVPTLLWRDRTERADGLGRNVVLSHYDPAVISEFVAEPHLHRRAPLTLQVNPSEQILETLVEWL